MADSVASALNANINRRIKSWPKVVRDLDPGPDDAIARNAWADEFEAVAQRVRQTPGTMPIKLKRAIQAVAEADDKPDDAPEKQRERYSFEKPDDVKW